MRLEIWLRFPKPRATIVSELRNGARMDRGIFEARAAAIAKERAGPAYVRALDNIVADTATSNNNLQPVDMLYLFDGTRQTICSENDKIKYKKLENNEKETRNNGGAIPTTIMLY